MQKKVIAGSSMHTEQTAWKAKNVKKNEPITEKIHDSKPVTTSKMILYRYYLEQI